MTNIRVYVYTVSQARLVFTYLFPTVNLGGRLNWELHRLSNREAKSARDRNREISLARNGCVKEKYALIFHEISMREKTHPRHTRKAPQRNGKRIHKRARAARKRGEM